MRHIGGEAGRRHHPLLQLVGHLNQRLRQLANLVTASRQALHARRQIAAPSQVVSLSGEIGDRAGDRAGQPDA